MKIAIITFHRAINYGAALQTYALFQYLQDKGHSVVVLDYRSSYLERSYKLHFSRSIVDIKKILLSPLSLKKKYLFRNFLRRNICITDRIQEKSELIEQSKLYDYVIVGSDQVWNARWSDYDDAYLLSFCPEQKRISYAASIGKESITEKEKEWLEKQLKKFKKISVREKSGKKLLGFLEDVDVRVNCDPVVLLRKEQWESIAVRVTEKNFILVYMLVPSTLIMRSAECISNSTGKKIVLINDNIRKQYNAKYKRNISPEEFLGLFKSADYVITNSFHGTMFSILFEKAFYVVLQEYEGAPNARFTDLLSDLCLEQRIISDVKDVNSDDTIDYAQVKKRLLQVRKKTDEYFDELMRLN